MREFAARKLTRLMEGDAAEKDVEVTEDERIRKACETVVMQLDEIPCEYRYELLTMSMVQLMENICYEGYFFHGLE